MKRVMTLGTAVCLLGFSTLLLASAPVHIPFHENSTHTLHLSSTNLNRLQVQRDTITAVICPEDKCVATDVPGDTGGGKTVQLSRFDAAAFTLYVVTAHHRHVSLLVTPKKMAGRTVILQPRDGARASTHEKATPYSRLLISTMQAMLQGDTPEGYGVEHINGKPLLLNGVVQIRAVRVYDGEQLRGTVYRITNHAQHSITLSPSEFYHPGIRAVALARQTLAPAQSGLLYTIGGKRHVS